jgi:sensor domain CHASE-containing protein
LVLGISVIDGLAMSPNRRLVLNTLLRFSLVLGIRVLMVLVMSPNRRFVLNTPLRFSLVPGISVIDGFGDVPQ